MTEPVLTEKHSDQLLRHLSPVVTAVMVDLLQGNQRFDKNDLDTINPRG